MDYTTETPARESDCLVPCLICVNSLSRVVSFAEMQPSDGIFCETRGNYGSTVWDSMDGEILVFLICDECLVKAGEQGRIMTYRHDRPICIPHGPVARMVVGNERLKDRGLVRWHKDLPRDDGPLVVDVADLETLGAVVTPLPPPARVLYHSIASIRAMVEAERR